MVGIELLGQVPPSPQQSASRATPVKMDTSKRWVSRIIDLSVIDLFLNEINLSVRMSSL